MNASTWRLAQAAARGARVKRGGARVKRGGVVAGFAVLAIAFPGAVGCESDEKLKAGDVRPMEINPSQTGGKVNIRPPSLRVTPG